ncbi:MAG TPA: DUF4129 domain-containing protein [Candidatus Dormibacteraeota bacterium]|nr:DUF4129 domain-containing protein [Candidatus Dormibacteraeota bacterium]
MLQPPARSSRPDRLGRAARSGAAGLVLAVGLTLVVVASHGRSLAPVGGVPPPASPVLGALGLGLRYGVVVLVDLAVILLLVVWPWRRPRRREHAGGQPPALRWWSRLALASVPIGLLALQVWLIAIQLHRRRGSDAGGAPSPLGPARRIAHATALGPGPLAPTLATWLLPLLAAALLVGGGFLLGWWRRRRRAAAARPLSALLAGSLDQGLLELDDGGDPRRAVIATYARMERVLAAHGLPRGEAEAPHEYLGRVLAGLHVSGPAASRLTGLFELARFSRRAVDEPMRADAARALSRLRDELEAA